MSLRSCRPIQLIAAAGLFLLEACGGGSGNLAAGIPIASGDVAGASPPQQQPSTPPQSQPSPSPASFLPLPSAGYGPTALPAQLASPGGASFNGASAFPAANTSFPVLAASLVANGKISSETLDAVGPTGTSWIPEPSSTSVTATVVSVAADGTMQIQLSVPSLNLISPLLTAKGVSALDYTLISYWTFSNQSNTEPIRFVQGVFGYETPAAAMPVSGTATYVSGAGYVGGSIFSANGDAIAGLYGGNGALSVNFATGQISGGLHNLVAHEDYGGDGYNIPWYDISIAASIAAGTNKFSGTTARGATSIPLGGICLCALPVSAALSSSATGSINGAFYGPAAQNLGAVWTIGDSKVFAFGSFGATAH